MAAGDAAPVLEQGCTNVTQAEINRAAQAINMDAPDYMLPIVGQPGIYDAAKGVANGAGSRARSNTNLASQGGQYLTWVVRRMFCMGLNIQIKTYAG